MIRLRDEPAGTDADKTIMEGKLTENVVHTDAFRRLEMVSADHFT